jgi:hypothetical protein
VLELAESLDKGTPLMVVADSLIVFFFNIFFVAVLESLAGAGFCWIAFSANSLRLLPVWQCGCPGRYGTPLWLIVVA